MPLFDAAMLCSYQTETIAASHEVLTVTGAREMTG